MAHQILNEKFVSYRQPAWHGLGQVVDQKMGAVEAGQIIKLPDIHTEPLMTLSGMPTDHKGIICTIDGGARSVLSVVHEDYNEITHKDFAATWDECVRENIETIGVLMDGAGMFMTAKLPDISVKGEEVNCYIMAENWLSGLRATKVRKTPVRVVCMNTLQMSDRASVYELKIIHSKPAIEQLKANLKEIIAKSTAEYQTLRDLFEILASTHLSDEQAKSIFKETYPQRQKPEGLLERLSSDKTALDKLAAWERNNGAQLEHQKACYNLYAGEGTGSMSVAAAGTAWGAYNAVAEYEQYAKNRRRAESSMFGMGKDRVVDAFESACAVANLSLSATEL